jgi:flagellar biogenesis protein FliO
MNETTDVQYIIAFVCVITLIGVASYVMHRIKRTRRIHYNEFLLHRRDNFPLGDMDVE